MQRNVLFTVMVKVEVMFLLSFKPLMGTYVEHFFAFFFFKSIETYLDLVWSRLSMNDGGIWNSWTLFTISLRDVSTASFLTPSDISTFPVVAVLLINPVQLNNLLALVQVGNCMWPSSCSGYLLSKSGCNYNRDCSIDNPTLSSSRS